MNKRPIEDIGDWKEWGSRLGLFLLFLICGLLALGPLQWGYIKLPTDIRAIYKIVIPLIFLVATLFMYRNDHFNQYWQVFFALFVVSFAFFVAWLGARFLTFLPTTPEGIAFAKLSDVLLLVIPILVLIRISGGEMASIYLQQGNLKVGLLIGLIGFVGFVAIAIPGAEDLFYGENITWEIILSWAPWILAFVLANGLMEELLYRGLFLKKFEPLFGSKASNLLQTVVFTLAHLQVEYTPELPRFLVIVFVLGLAFGYVMQRTDSLLGSTLFHAGADVVVIIGFFATL